jgi:hypothetical protein
MSTVSGTFSTVYDQNILRNIFIPGYIFQNGEFQSRIDTNLPGNVEIGDSNTNYSLLLNGELVATELSVSAWSTFPAVSTVNVANYPIVNVSSIAVGKTNVSSNYVIDVSGSILCSSNVVSSGNIVAGGGISTGIGNLTIPLGNIVVASGNVVIVGGITGTTITSQTSVIAENIGSATIYCVSSGNVFPLSIQPSYTSISFSSVIDPSFSVSAQSITLAPRTLFEFVSTSPGILNVQLSNASSIPVRITFPTPGTSRTPDFINDSYLLRAI